MTNIALGKNGEEIAVKFLEKQGYKILETNKHFSKAYIPLNARSGLKNPDCKINADGIGMY